MKTAMHLCFILVSLSVIASMSIGIGQKQQHSREKRRIELSRPEGLDVTFLIDTSGSIQLREFRSAIMFVKMFAKEIGLSRRSDGARIAVLTTGRFGGFYDDNSFHTNIGMSLETVLLLLDHVQHGGNTNLAGSLRVYKQDMIPINLIEREFPKQYLFILSDGQYTRGGNPVNIAKELKEEGVEIFSIKIGDGVSSYSQRRATNVLIGMSSEAEMNRDGMDPHYFDLRHYPTMEYLVEQLINGSIEYSECGIAGKTDITLGNIINGRVAQPGEWPWMVAIFRSRATYAPLSAFRYLCGGTLLDTEWVLTSAHCFMEGTKTNPARFGVMFGTNNRHIQLNDFPFTTFRRVRSIHFYPGWGSGPFRRIPNHDGSWADDIALLHLDIRVDYSSTTRSVCLPSLNQNVTDEIGVITGWGVAANHSLSPSDVQSRYDQSDELRQAQIPIVTHDENPFRCPRRTAEKIICAGSVTELVDSCRGDGGGPLMIKVENHGTDAPRWYQIGITSFGRGCADPNYPFGRYTDVRQYVDWIETTMLNAGR